MNRTRSGVSPVIATTMIIAITVVLGLALWAYANAGVTSATQSYSDSVKQYGDFTKDRFVVSNVDFNNPAPNRIAIWIFNSGKQETDLCHYVSTDPDRCRDHPSITVVERGSITAISPADFCQYDPSNNCLTRTMPDGNLVNDFRIPSGEVRKFSFDTGTTINIGSTYDITIYSDTGASTSIMMKAG